MSAENDTIIDQEPPDFSAAKHDLPPIDFKDHDLPPPKPAVKTSRPMAVIPIALSLASIFISAIAMTMTIVDRKVAKNNNAMANTMQRDIAIMEEKVAELSLSLHESQKHLNEFEDRVAAALSAGPSGKEQRERLLNLIEQRRASRLEKPARP